MREINVGNRIIGDGHPTFIIAEGGINHNGELHLAKEIIKKAKEAGADAVKFQIFKAGEFCTKKSEYFDLFKSLEFEEEEWIEIAKFAEETGIPLMASVFGKESADILDRLNLSAYKIASGDLTDIPLLRYIARKNRPMIISTGMASLGEIYEALDEIYKAGNSQIALLHCVSCYPTNYEETNLKAIEKLKMVFDVPVGFSDHTQGTIIPVAAVALGANIIEKHFTLDKNMEGPDHKLSLDPNEFKSMVENIRIIEKALGEGHKVPMECEKKTRISARRSIVAERDIKKGEKISEKDVSYKRPATGIEPKFIDIIVNRRVKRDIKKDETIKWEDFMEE